MSDVEPIQFSPRRGAGAQTIAAQGPSAYTTGTFFTRLELNQILHLYGRKVADGEWRDYAIDFGREKAVFSVFRRTSEVPLYRIEKNPKLAARQGAFSVVAATGHILKRGHDLARVLGVFDKDRARLALV